MPQFGASTTIAASVRLILLDCFETLVELCGDVYGPRKGVVEFLEHFHARAGVTLVVISDAELGAIERALAQAGLKRYIATIYHAGNAIDDLGEGRFRKRLDMPLSALSIRADETVFVGDSPLDAFAATHFAIPFIRVPRSEDRAFTFAQLIAGPSRYNSAEFSATLFETYSNQRQTPKPP